MTDKEYFDFLVNVGGTLLNNNVEFPDFRLMVGNAEELSSQGVLISSDQVPDFVLQRQEELNQISNDDLMQMINDQRLEVDDISVIGKMTIGQGRTY